MMDLMFLLIVLAAVLCILAYVVRRLFEKVINIDEYLDDLDDGDEDCNELKKEDMR